MNVTYKIGLVHCKADQRTEEEMYNNGKILDWLINLFINLFKLWLNFFSTLQSTDRRAFRNICTIRATVPFLRHRPYNSTKSFIITIYIICLIY